MAARSPQGWFRRKKGKLVYCCYNAIGKERSAVIGPGSLTDAEGWSRGRKTRSRQACQKTRFPLRRFSATSWSHYLATGKTKAGRDKAESTKAIEESIARLYLRPQWAKRIANRMEPLEIQEWFDALDLQDKTKIRSLMSAVYRHGQKFNLIPTK